jgi:hypothetical protein
MLGRFTPSEKSAPINHLRHDFTPPSTQRRLSEKNPNATKITMQDMVELSRGIREFDTQERSSYAPPPKTTVRMAPSKKFTLHPLPPDPLRFHSTTVDAVTGPPKKLPVNGLQSLTAQSPYFSSPEFSHPKKEK